MIPSIYCFLFLYIFSFIIVMSSEDWFLVWMGLEINMMSFLILIYRRYSIGIIESCLSYFFIQSLGSALFVSMFYLNYYMVGGFMSLILSYSVGAGPFFYWFPSLCSGIGWMSCFMLMMFQKILPLLLISMFIHWILWVIIVISLLVGVLGSFNQSNISQLMAYSSVHHLGWIFLVSMGGNMMWMLYLMMYGLVLFSVVILMYKDDIVDLSMVFMSKNKMLFMLSMLSMAGMPPLLGFFMKWMALFNVISMNMLYLMMLLLVSVVMLYIYIRIVYDVFMGGGAMIGNDYIIYSYMSNMEVVSLVGIVFGIVLGIIMIM